MVGHREPRDLDGADWPILTIIALGRTSRLLGYHLGLDSFV